MYRAKESGKERNRINEVLGKSLAPEIRDSLGESPAFGNSPILPNASEPITLKYRRMTAEKVGFACCVRVCAYVV
jgi:hypothetical protein